MNVQTIVSPSGEELVVISRQDYQDLLDARDHAVAMRDVAARVMPTLADAELDSYLAAPSPLAYWRERRGLTQAALATAAGISRAYLAQIETGHKVGEANIYARLARRLGVRIEDLLAEER